MEAEVRALAGGRATHLADASGPACHLLYSAEANVKHMCVIGCQGMRARVARREVTNMMEAQASVQRVQLLNTKITTNNSWKHWTRMG